MQTGKVGLTEGKADREGRSNGGEWTGKVGLMEGKADREGRSNGGESGQGRSV